MASRSSDKALKQQKDKHHCILRELVQEIPNKTCADCLAKGPRWSSWNLGVFVCIRCAGIHRNLGVHISKVKSVDLDSWSVEQIEQILKWGNKRAGEYFECYLPKDYTRPSGNHAVESFIRNKYEKKLYIMKDGEPECNPSSKLNRLSENTTSASNKENKVASSNKRRDRPEKKQEEKLSNDTILNIAKERAQIGNGGVANAAKLAVNQHPAHAKSSSMNDLLSLDTPAPAPTAVVKQSASSDDLLNFGSFSAPVAFESNDLFSGKGQSTSTAASEGFPQTTGTTETPPLNSASTKSTKESILSLYSSGNTGQQQKMYGVPGGMYMQAQQQQQPQMMMSQQQMSQQQMPQQPMNYGYPQNSMATTQMNQMNYHMQGMNINTRQQQQQQQQQQEMMGQQQQQYGYPQQQQYNNMNQFNMKQPQYNGQQANFGHQANNQMFNAAAKPMNNQNSNMQQTNNFNAMHQGNMANGNWPQQQQGMMGNTQSNGLMGNNMNSGNTMNNQLWN